MKQHPGTFTAGLIFVIIGIVYLLEAFDVWQVNVARTWPLVLIAIGGVIILNSRHDSRPSSLPPTPPSADEPKQP